MANELKMDKVFAVLALHKARLSNRAIAEKLGIHRETVARHIGLAEALAKPAKEAPIGSGSPKPARDAPIGSAGSGGADPAGKSEVRPPIGDGFIALLPTAAGDKVVLAVAEGTALLGSNRSAAAAPYGTGGPLGTACPIDGGNSRAKGGQASQCQPYREVILGKLGQGLCAQRIYQDLVTDNNFTGSYWSVRRFAGKLTAATELPFTTSPSWKL